MIRLFTPGPVHVPQPVLDAAARYPLYHHSAEFSNLCQRVWQKLQHVFCTNSPVVLLPGSGMTGIDAAFRSVLKPKDHVLVISHGRFGERLVQVSERAGYVTYHRSFEWGLAPTADDVTEALRSFPQTTVLWIVYSETSTGVTVNLQEIAASVRQEAPHVLLCIDAVTALAIHTLQTDAWGLDVVAAGIQKGLMCPPGLACLSLSQRAQQRLHEQPRTAYTLDLMTVLDAQQSGKRFAWTPPVTLVAALETALDLILSEGLDAVIERHRANWIATRSFIHASGLRPFGESSSFAVSVALHCQADQIRSTLAEQYRFMVAGGQERLSGSAIRIGTCGAMSPADLNELFSALANVLTLFPDKR